ncbi:hypothetical protein SAMN05192559_101154 [Halobacillus karajensis]|uniref:Uncharacterized protein n=1 Tax=Halobacillus karajensis TaxID=195088 RepID=A0A024P2M3_9BACI|nr:hypothetical protein [Halobacillus karajensis]CDQ19193.1 hypothetical protein BN982_01478 [Halobacillus karajensis]CDQ22733.1 hypothetical protein BN983_00948 [Halobacillus karajensis]CDQ26215.1 hypothetical protein BN981_00428 [Halobacillus karajensis]SEH40275.1 hypothetical protein SAMN05192559_101154 [Halobacillus karajensis]
MPQLTKLLLEHKELSLSARYSVRIDRTIVIEPLRQLTEDTFKRVLDNLESIHTIGIENAEDSSVEKYVGPFHFSRVNGILIFKPAS